MQTIIQDIRYALRQLRKSPGFTLTAVITLALGIGANTAIFTLIQGILLRSLPVTDPAQLYRIGDNDDCCVEGGFPGDAGTTGDYTIFSYDLYLHLKNSAPEFEQLAAVQAGQWHWSMRRGNALPKSLRGEFVSGNYFSTLGLGAYAGRVFSDSDDTPASLPTTVLSYQAWQGEYAGDPSIVGSTVFHSGAALHCHRHCASQIFWGSRIGLPARFLDAGSDGALCARSKLYPASSGVQLALPARQSARRYEYRRIANRSLPRRCASGFILVRCSPRMAARASFPSSMWLSRPAAAASRTCNRRRARGLKMLMILSCVVLLIACANIANLLLARATTRRADIALRMALGAGRRRVIRQILTESVLLSCLGGLAGLAVAYAGSHTILALAFPDATQLPINASPSLAVLGFAFLVSLITGILFGVGPAWLSSHAQPAEALRGVNRSTRDRSSLPQKSLVVFQAALSLVLLAGAILMTKSLANLEHQKFGVATSNRYVLHFDPAGAGYTVDRLPALYRQLEDRFSALPGVANFRWPSIARLRVTTGASASSSKDIPLPGRTIKCGSTWDRVTPHFLDSIGVPMVRGRDLTGRTPLLRPGRRGQ